MTQTERLILRARDAIAECLTTHLSVPSIWFDAPWPGPEDRVDLLAIDRAGVGDVHVVGIVRPPVWPVSMKKVVDRLMLIPAQFRWIAVYGGPKETLGPSKRAPNYLYPSEEMGRVGVVVFFKTQNDDLGARIRYRAERFRGNLSKEADAFVARNRPDIEFR